MKKIGFTLIAILAVVVGLLVGTLNSSPVSLDLLWVQYELPLGMAILAGFSVGLVAGLIFLYVFRILPLRHQLRKARNQLSRQTYASQTDNPGLTLDDD